MHVAFKIGHLVPHNLIPVQRCPVRFDIRLPIDTKPYHRRTESYRKNFLEDLSDYHVLKDKPSP